MRVEAHHRGVSVTVELDEPIRVTDIWTGEVISIDRLSAHVYRELADGDDLTHMRGKGRQVNKDGRVGLRERVGISVPAKDLPAAVREAVVAAVNDQFESGGA